MDNSKEQDGSFNMTIIDAKRKLLVLKREHCLNKSIKKRLNIVEQYCYNKSFVRVDKNTRVIADRGWGIYTRNILTFSQIKTTMIDSDYLKDIKYYIILSPSSLVSDI